MQETTLCVCTLDAIIQQIVGDCSVCTRNMCIKFAMKRLACQSIKILICIRDAVLSSYVSTTGHSQFVTKIVARDIGVTECLVLKISHELLS